MVQPVELEPKLSKKEFIEKHVMGYHMEEDFHKILEPNLINIIHNIILAEATEMEMMHNWELHFKSMKVPYAITSSRKKIQGRSYYELVCELWKEKVVGKLSLSDWEKIASLS